MTSVEKAFVGHADCYQLDGFGFDFDFDSSGARVEPPVAVRCFNLTEGRQVQLEDVGGVRAPGYDSATLV
jgi:hypothetical protein